MACFIVSSKQEEAAEIFIVSAASSCFLITDVSGAYRSINRIIIHYKILPNLCKTLMFSIYRLLVSYIGV